MLGELKGPLKRLFSGTPVIVFRKPAVPIRHVIFDFDGVLLKECGIAERSYAWLVQSLRARRFVDDDDIQLTGLDSLHELRAMVKGKSPPAKLRILRKEICGSDAAFPKDEADALKRWYLVHRREIVRRFGDDFGSYQEPGGAQFVKGAKEAGFEVLGLTANPLPQAKWLMEFVGLTSFFAPGGILGFPLDADRVDKFASKADMLRDMVRGSDPREFAFVGDGFSDVQAGVEVGVYSVGIAISEQNGKKVLAENPDLIARSSASFQGVIDVLKASLTPE